MIQENLGIQQNITSLCQMKYYVLAYHQEKDTELRSLPHVCSRQTATPTAMQFLALFNLRIFVGQFSVLGLYLWVKLLDFPNITPLIRES